MTSTSGLIIEIFAGTIVLFLVVKTWPIISVEFYKWIQRRRVAAEALAANPPKPSRLTMKMQREDEMAELNHRAEKALATARAEVAETNLEIFRQQMAKHAEIGETLIALPPTQNIDTLRNAKVPTLEQMESNINARSHTLP